MSAGILRRRRQAGVLEIIDADGESAADLLGPMRVRDDRQFARVRFVDDRFRFLQRHLVLVDQLDDVDAGVGESSHLGARIVRAFHAPAIKFCAGIRLVLNERTGDVKRRAGNFAALIRSRTVMLSSSGAPRSRALVTPAMSS